MSATNTQIVELAKRGFDAKQIAGALGLTEECVLSVIMQDSKAVKDIHNAGLASQFDKMQDMAVKGLEHLALYAENEAVRAKVLTYIIDHQLGLKKPRERVTVQNNFQFLVERAEKAKLVRAQTLGLSSPSASEGHEVDYSNTHSREARNTEGGSNDSNYSDNSEIAAIDIVAEPVM